ncbi:MAG: hypothetical protein O3A39_06785 [Proteobacteria bacterium]|nr:hypothetical protein [Pseudomonadota bacterium]
MSEAVKLTQKQKVEKKYGAMVSYYGELLALCHQAIQKNSLLSKLDPMGQKTSATTLFIRTCARMDKTDATDIANKLVEVSKDTSLEQIA